MGFSVASPFLHTCATVQLHRKRVSVFRNVQSINWHFTGTPCGGPVKCYVAENQYGISPGLPRNLILRHRCGVSGPLPDIGNIVECRSENASGESTRESAVCRKGYERHQETVRRFLRQSKKQLMKMVMIILLWCKKQVHSFRLEDKRHALHHNLKHLDKTYVMILYKTLPWREHSALRDGNYTSSSSRLKSLKNSSFPCVKPDISWYIKRQVQS